MESLSGIAVVLPSLNPDGKLLRVIDGLLEYGFSRIVVVNDGSKQECMGYFDKAAQHPQVQLLHHRRNRGKGAALKTAFSWIMENCPEAVGVVTADGDDQHRPEDIRACALGMLETNRIVLGVRDFSGPDVPLRSRMGNRITRGIFRAFVGMNIADTQTGLRAIPRRELGRMLGIAGERYEYETNMLLTMKAQAIAFEQVKIQTVYVQKNKSSHFRPLKDSWRIYRLIFAHFFKYTASSLVSSMVDEVLFVVLTGGLTGCLTGFALTAVPTLTARAMSALLNFFLNQRMVFQSQIPVGKALKRYAVVAVPQVIAQMGLTYGAYRLFGIGAERVILRGVIHAVVMVILFCISYVIQQQWVFAQKRNKE